MIGDDGPALWTGAVEAETESVLERLPPRRGHDRVFYVLSASRRRAVLYHLANATDDGVAERRELVDAVLADEATARENGGSESVDVDEPIRVLDDDDRRERDAVERDLKRVHLPCLVEAGYVDYDPRQGTVRYDPTPLLDSWVDRVHEFEG